MPNLFKHNATGTESNSLFKGDWAINLKEHGGGPTGTTGFYNGIDIPAGGYAIYGPGNHVRIATDEAELLFLVGKLGGDNSNINAALIWASNTPEVAIVDRFYENIVTDGLVLHLDASYVASYPKGGNKWYDLSGNNHHFTLYNGPLYDADGPGCVSFDGSNDYAQSDSTIDLTHTGEITVISSFTVPSTGTGSVMIYEHTNNWNSGNVYNITGGGTTSYGGFGFVPNSNGTGLVPGLNHIQLRGNNSYNGVNAYGVTTEFNIHSVHHLFTSTGFETDYYLNDSYVVPDYSYASSNSGVFGNDYMWLGKRGSSNPNGPCKISTLMIWDRKLSAEELSQVYNSIKNRFGL
jgi:hypothetical protein